MCNIDNEDPQVDSLLWTEKLKRITGTLHLLLSEGVFFGLVTSPDYDPSKANDILNDLYQEMRKLYKNNLPFMQRQKNLKPNVYDKIFKPTFHKIMNNRETNISRSTLSQAEQKTEDLR